MSKASDQIYGTYAHHSWLPGVWSYDYEEGDTKPWWMSADRWKKEQDQYHILHAPSAVQATYSQYTDKWKAGLVSLQQWYTENAPSAPQYSTNWDTDYASTYQGYGDTIAKLLATIQGGTTDKDRSDALQNMLQQYGMTPEQWAEIQKSLTTTPEEMNQRAEDIAFDPNSEANRSFEEMIRSQQRVAEAGIGKQLEAIFSERGGLGGFAAAQEYTLQMSSQFLKQRSDFMTSRLADQLQLINADKDRNIGIINTGIDNQRQFLDDRWAQLQTAFEDTSVEAQRILDEYTTLHESERADFETEMNLFLAQFQTMKDLLLTEVGIDKESIDLWNSLYQQYVTPYLDALALEM